MSEKYTLEEEKRAIDIAVAVKDSRPEDLQKIYWIIQGINIAKEEKVS